MTLLQMAGFCALTGLLIGVGASVLVYLLVFSWDQFQDWMEERRAG